MIARRTPLKRSSKPIARRAKPARVRRSAAGQAKAKADRAWSEAVKANMPACWRISVNSPLFHICREPWDAAHVLSRTFPATRKLPENGLKICRWLHSYMTAHPLEWEAFCRQLLGDQEYDRLDAKAHGQKEA